MSLQDAITQFKADSDLVHSWAHGNGAATVATEGGALRSPAKLIADQDAAINQAADGVLAGATAARDKAQDWAEGAGTPGAAGTKSAKTWAAAAAADSAAATAAKNEAQATVPTVQVADYAGLRAYAGAATCLFVTGFLVTAAPSGIAGVFVRDDTDAATADNGCTVLVAANGKRWKRQFSGPVNFAWTGAVGDAGDSAKLQALIDYLTTVATRRAPGVIVFDRPQSGQWRIWNVKLKSNVVLRASSYSAGKRSAEDVEFYPPDGAAAGWMIYTDAVASTNYAGVEGFWIHGRAAPRATVGTADNGYTQGFGGLNFGPGYHRSIRSNKITDWGEQGLVTSGNVNHIEDNLLYNCVMYRVRNALIGAAQLTETDSYINRNEWGTSSQIEGAITNAQPYLCAVYYPAGGNNFNSQNVAEISEIGCVENSWHSRHAECRYELNYAHGLVSTDGGQVYVNPYFRNNSRAATGVYDDIQVQTNFKPMRQIIGPQFEVNAGFPLTRWQINDLVTQGEMTAYMGRRPARTSFSFPGQQWNEQFPPGFGATNGHNAIRNSIGGGAVVGTPGTLPTNWTWTGPSNLSHDVVGTGYENGLPYVDIHVYGHSAGTYWEMDFEPVTGIPAAKGQTWTVSAFVKLLSGTNGGTLSCGMSQFSAASAYLGGVAGQVAPSLAPLNGDLGRQRAYCTGTLDQATVAYMRPYIQGVVTNGADVDFTLRIAVPQAEKFAAPGAPVLTTNTEVAMPRKRAVVYPFQGQNAIRNAALAGAAAGTPGALPTNWSQGGGAGLVTSVVGIGTENGVPYIDISVVGVAPAASFWQVIFEGSNIVAAATGQAWSASVFTKLVAGSFAGFTGATLNVNEYASGAFVTGNGSAVTFPPENENLAECRVVTSRTLNGGATITHTTCALVLTYANGANLNATFRIGLPQLEKRSAAGHPICTNGAAVALF